MIIIIIIIIIIIVIIIPIIIAFVKKHPNLSVPVVQRHKFSRYCWRLPISRHY